MPARPSRARSDAAPRDVMRYGLLASAAVLLGALAATAARAGSEPEESVTTTATIVLIAPTSAAPVRRQGRLGPGDVASYQFEAAGGDTFVISVTGDERLLVEIVGPDAALASRPIAEIAGQTMRIQDADRGPHAVTVTAPSGVAGAYAIEVRRR